MLDCPHNVNWVYSPYSPFCKKCKCTYRTCGKPNNKKV